MTRKKVKLAFITNDSARKATYKKRKRGLLKKMEELTTLCDVKACGILYSSYETKPVVWPGPFEARDVISSFKRLPEMEKVKKMVSQEEFLRQRLAKAHEQLKRQQKDNREKEMTQVMYQYLTGKGTQNMSMLDLTDLSWVIDQNLIEINNRIEKLSKEISTTCTTLNNNTNYVSLPVQHTGLIAQPFGPPIWLNGSNHCSSTSHVNTEMNMSLMSHFSNYQGNNDINPALWANFSFLP